MTAAPEHGTDDRCHACRTYERFDSGEHVDQLDLNRAAMWGCCCDPADAAAAAEWMDLMTR